MKYVVPGVIFAAVSALGAAQAGEPLSFTDEATRVGYSLGHQIGADFKREDVKLNADALVQGIQDGLADAEPKMPQGEMDGTLMELKKKIVEAQKKHAQEKVAARLAEGKAFMDENAKKEGVVTTEGGLQYKVIEEGSGKSPGPTDKVTVQYRGTLIDGKEFDSSYKRGKAATFSLNQVIKGWSEGLQLMKEGGKAQLFIAPDLAYGDHGPMANQTLIFDVELISVGEPEAAKAPAPAEEGESK